MTKLNDGLRCSVVQAQTIAGVGYIFNIWHGDKHIYSPTFVYATEKTARNAGRRYLSQFRLDRKVSSMLSYRPAQT